MLRAISPVTVSLTLLVLALAIFATTFISTNYPMHLSVVMQRSIHETKHEEYSEVNAIFETGECSEGYRAELYSQKLNKWMYVCQVGQKIPVRFAGKVGNFFKILTEYFAKEGYPLQVAKDYIQRKITEEGYVLMKGTLPKGITAPFVAP